MEALSGYRGSTGVCLGIRRAQYDSAAVSAYPTRSGPAPGRTRIDSSNTSA